jgi:hypothetical protein
MPMTKTLTIPHDLSSLNMKVGDSLQITVSADCTWCYSDPTPCFPGGLLPAGSYTATTPHTTYGPYLASAAGTVNVNAVTSGPCNPQGLTAVPHTIIVTSSK